MHDTSLLVLLLLLGATLFIVLVQSWRLARTREMADAHGAIARANVAAATREQDRQVAAYARSFRAGEGERGASALLEGAGYQVIQRQVPGSWTLRVDGVPVTFGLRADYLVARGGRRYIAEVKTGRVAPRLAHGPTRRQLLEYLAGFDVHGVILVDADAESIVHVEIDMFTGDAPGREAYANRGGGNGARGSAFGGIKPSVLAIAVAVTLSIGIVVGTVMGK